MNRRRYGAWGEEQAVAFLEKKGYTVIERNFRSPSGEIDIIARLGERVVFVEVKVVSAYGREELGRIVGREKRRRIVSTADAFLTKHAEFRDRPLRCDVIAVCPKPDGIVHLEDAF
ncbi:MAG: YraN family protein [Spirochaetales bacterium]|nr:YraN family protein [Spirochaetales bacterium]